MSAGFFTRRLFPVACCCTWLASPAIAADGPFSSVGFNRDVRPILADRCFACHGADAQARQADLRLDDPASALAERDGPRILVPGRPEESELFGRITSTDEAERMPPAEHPRLTETEVAVIRRWIEAGAEFEPHWAFVAPERMQPPIAAAQGWVRNPVDTFVLARLEEHGLWPAAEADRRALIRRVTLDLIGLPPTPEEVAGFVADESPDAYERLVDRLLASPRYGERMALIWLDAARYADTGGYQGDIPRVMWPWRDWVIEAFNRNQPFDQFTIEQIAGDLLPHATREQKLATGFNRNHRINDEDGIVHEEFRVEYVVDRVETTATVWLGLTLGCARCHDHKYDPFTQRDFYRLSAYFNSVAESGRGHGNAPPLMFVDPGVEEELAALDARIAALSAAAENETEHTRPPEHRAADEAEELKKRRAALAASSVTSMVMQDLPEPRETYILERGAYDKHGERVAHGTPAVLSPLPADAPPNRLALAHWLVDPQNPLPARVTVNRLWLMLLGRGIVRTQEDFGTRGELPTHPELLDWLATEFVRSGWDVKELLRLIVTSATYRQSSRVDRDAYERDRANDWFSRGPRQRLPAELVRDQALAAAGLLDDRLGGPSVMPYQPAGLWEQMVSTTNKWEQSRGADVYRRSLYTYLRRTVPHPAMVAFDMPNREICQARRAATNTPLAALVLMNDPTFVEAARVLAMHALRDGRTDVEARLRWMFERVLCRTPRPEELHVLRAQCDKFRARFEAAPDRAAAFVSVGEFPVDASLPTAELAAYTALAGLIFNLDETVTKE